MYTLTLKNIVVVSLFLLIYFEKKFVGENIAFHWIRNKIHICLIIIKRKTNFF